MVIVLVPVGVFEPVVIFRVDVPEPPVTGLGVKLALEREVEIAPISAMLTAAEIVARSREDKVTH